jgi:hypothetical protein
MNIHMYSPPFCLSLFHIFLSFIIMLAMNVHIESPAFSFFPSSFIFDNKVAFFFLSFFSFSGIFQLFQLCK